MLGRYSFRVGAGQGQGTQRERASFGQLAVLTKIGLTKAQGNYWSPAVPAAASRRIDARACECCLFGMASQPFVR